MSSVISAICCLKESISLVLADSRSFLLARNLADAPALRLLFSSACLDAAWTSTGICSGPEALSIVIY
jgi:hypothetical protein